MVSRLTDALLGQRPELECDESSKYFVRIHACVPLAVASSPLFASAFSELKKYCEGNRVIATKEDLESLRYCDHIRGGLTIEVRDASADFYALNHIGNINGMSMKRSVR